MLTTVITLLIYLCILVAVVYLIQWVLAELGINLPDKVMKIIWIIVALVALLYIVSALPRLGIPVL